MKQIMIQSSIAQNFMANGISDYCYNLRLNYKLTEKVFKKDEAQKLKIILKSKISKNYNRFRITTKSDGLSFKTSGSPIGPVNNETKSRAHKKASS